MRIMKNSKKEKSINDIISDLKRKYDYKTIGKIILQVHYDLLNENKSYRNSVKNINRIEEDNKRKYYERKAMKLVRERFDNFKEVSEEIENITYSFERTFQYLNKDSNSLEVVLYTILSSKHDDSEILEKIAKAYELGSREYLNDSKVRKQRSNRSYLYQEYRKILKELKNLL